MSRGITAGHLLFAGATAGAVLSVAGPWWAPGWTLPTAVCAFLAGRRPGRTRHTALALLAVLAAGVVAIALVPSWIVQGTWFVAVLVCAAMLPWFAGRFWRQYQELTRAGWERAAHLEREQRLVAEQARLRERTRIAQDVHDALGHDLSLIALSAGALKLAPGLPDAHRAAAQDIRAKAGAAVERLGEVIGVLRHEGAPGAPPDRGVADVVARVRAAGLAVELSVAGEPGEAPPVVERAVRRVVQESLTNVAKHAPGATASVRIHHTPAETEVRVTNGPVPVSPTPTGSTTGAVTGGFGLIGLDERVRLAGGSLIYGPTDPSSDRPATPANAEQDNPPGDPGRFAMHDQDTLEDADRGDERPHSEDERDQETSDDTDRGTASGPSGGCATQAPHAADQSGQRGHFHGSLEQRLATAGAVGQGNRRPRSGRSPALRPTTGAAAGQGKRRGHCPPGKGYCVVATLPHDVPAGARPARAPVPAGAPRRPARALRHTLLAAVMVPLVTGALLGGALIAWETVTARRSVLAPDDYASLRIGQDRAELARFLPDRQTTRRPVAAEPDEPGTACEYYAMTADRFDNQSGDVYRLCFRNGVLVSADAFTGNAVR